MSWIIRGRRGLIVAIWGSCPEEGRCDNPILSGRTLQLSTLDAPPAQRVRSMGDRDGVERPFQLTGPEIQEIQEHGEIRREIVLLPDIGLKKTRVAGQAIKDCRPCQPVPLKLTDERP